MGSTMKPTIFNDRVATALKNWHHTAKKHIKHSNHSGTNTPFASNPPSPTHGMSPVHLLHNSHHSSLDSLHNSPRRSNVENDHSDVEDLPLPRNISGPNETYLSRYSEQEMMGIQDPSSMQLPTAPYLSRHSTQERMGIQDPNSMQLPTAPRAIGSQHEINMTSEFSFSK